MKLLLNQPLAGYEAGREVTVQTDANGVPLDKFWRRRLKDAEIDNCVTIIMKPKKKAKRDDV